MRGLTILALLAASAVSTGSAPSAQSPSPRVIEITAERFDFWPPEIAVSEHETVELRIHSEDTMHGFRLLGTSVNIMVPKRGKGLASATVTGLKPGRYTFECSRMCGAGHHFMRGVLIVKPGTGGAP